MSVDREALVRYGIRSCLIVAAAAALLIVGPCAYVYVSHAFEARRINEQNAHAVAPVIEALDAYRRQHGRYPSSLCDLYPAYLRAVPKLSEGTQLLFTSSPDGRSCWLAVFPHRLATFILPSDAAREFDSDSRSWSLMDIADTKAKYDERWAHCVEQKRRMPQR